MTSQPFTLSELLIWLREESDDTGDLSYVLLAERLSEQYKALSQAEGIIRSYRNYGLLDDIWSRWHDKARLALGKPPYTTEG